MSLVVLRGDAVSDEVERLLEPSHGSPERARSAAAEYRSGRWVLYGWIKDSELVGCVGCELKSNVGVIRSLVVTERHRGEGIGRAMVEAALADVGRPWIEAETDSDAVGFYRRLGFTTTSLGATRVGIERFRCMRAEFE